MTTMGGKSAISEKRHPFALGSGSGVMSGTVHHFLRDADLVLAVGTSLDRHDLVTPIPADKRIVQVTNAPDDLHKSQPRGVPRPGRCKARPAPVSSSAAGTRRPEFAKRRENVVAEIARVPRGMAWRVDAAADLG